MSTQQEITPQEELYHVQENTNDDGSVMVEITGWDKDDRGAIVEYRMPTMETKTERMRWPTRNTDDYKLVRILRQCGLDLVGIEQLEGSKMRYKDGEIVAPKLKPRRERLLESIIEWANSNKGLSFVLVSIPSFLTGVACLLVFFSLQAVEPEKHILANAGFSLFMTVGLIIIAGMLSAMVYEVL